MAECARAQSDELRDAAASIAVGAARMVALLAGFDGLRRSCEAETCITGTRRRRRASALSSFIMLIG
jgi:hypothetical protein